MLQRRSAQYSHSTFSVLHQRGKYVAKESTSIVKPTRCTNVSNLFYFGTTLYMFRTVFPSIIRSSRLYIQQQAFVKQILLSACNQCLKFILFWNDTLHVSGGLSIHHQEFKTVHTATGICQTDTAVCLQPMSQIYFILERQSTCFWRSFCPSSGVQDCTYSNRHLSNRYCCLLACMQTAGFQK